MTYSHSPRLCPIQHPAKLSRRRRFAFSAAGLLAFALVTADSARAADGTWGGSASGNWNTAGNWVSSVIPGTAGTAGTDTSTAFFNGTSTSFAITLDNSYNLRNITFGAAAGSAAYTIAASGGSMFSLTSGGSITVSNFAMTGTQTISAPIVIGSAAGGTQTYTFDNNSTSFLSQLNFTGPITSAGTSGITTLTLKGAQDITAINTISGNISDSGTGNIMAVTRHGNRGQYYVLSGVNTYSGITSLGGGVTKFNDGVGLSANSALLISTTGISVPSIETNANFTRSLGTGAGQISFTTAGGFSAVGGNIVIAFGGLANPTTITLGSPNFTTTGINLNATGVTGNYTGLTFRNPVNTNGQLFTISSGNNTTIVGPTIVSGVISGNGSFAVSSANGPLDLTGANTFTGPVSIGSLSILRAYTLNSVVGGSASSNLGAPTTAANGTISFGNGSLIYLGTGETTDRILNLAGAGTLNHSGTGALKFSGNVTSPTVASTLSLFGGVQNGTPTQGYTATGEISGVISDGLGATSVTKGQNGITGGVTWILSGANTYTGLTNVINGRLTIANSAGLGSAVGATTVSIGGLAAQLALDGTTVNGPLAIGAEALTLNGAGLRGAEGALLNIGGNNSYAGLITLGSASTIGSDAGTLTLSHAGTITGPTFGLTLAGAGNGSLASIIGTTTGTITKTGTGTWTLSGANTNTGATTVNGGTLVLAAPGYLGGGTGIGTALTLGGGIFKFQAATTGSNQTMGNLTLTASTGNGLTVAAGTSGTSTLTVGSTWTRGANSTLNIDISTATGSPTLTSNPSAVANSNVLGFATVTDSTAAGFGFLSGGNIVRLTGQTTLANNSNAAATDFITTPSGSGTYLTLNAALNPSYNSLTINNASASGANTLDLGANTVTLTSKGLLLTGGTQNFTIQNGIIGASGSEVIVHQFSSGNLSINGTISGATGTLTKNGSGTLTLGGANSYTGVTAINGGTLATSASNVLADTSSLLVNAGATFSLGGNDTIGTLNGAGNINLNGNTLTSSGGTLVSGIISGSGGSLVTGTQAFSGANTYTGTTTVNAGATLTIRNNAGLGSTAGGTIVNTGGILSLDGATLNTAIAIGNEALTLNAATLSVTNTSGATTFGGLITLGGNSTITLPGTSINSFCTFAVTNTGTITGSGYTLTLGSGGVSGGAVMSFGTLASAIGTGSGGVTKTGLGTWTLTNANTYTGTTAISAGQLIITNNAGLGSTTGSTTVASTGSLGLDGSAGNLAVGNEALSLNGTGVTGNLKGAFENIAGNNTYAGLITLAGDSTIQSDLDSTIAFTNTGTITAASNNTMTLTGQGNGSIASIIGTGSGGVTKNGNGTWTLSGANTYTGATTVNQGILTIKNNSGLGTTATGTTVVAGGGLALDGSGGDLTIGSEALSLSGSGVSGTTGALQNVAGNNVYGGTITLANPTTIQSDAGSLSLTGGITGANYLTLAGAGNGSISSGVIGTGVGGLNKTGAGTWTLSTANTYTGPTTITAGKLAYGTSNVIASGVVNVNGATAILDLGASQTDTVGTVTVAGGGSILGTGTSTLTSTGTFEMQSGTVTAGLAGSVPLNKTTTGTVVLSGTNTYSGVTTVAASGGTLQFAKQVSLYNNTPASWTTSNIIVNNGGTLALNVGGSGEFISSDVTTIAGLSSFAAGSSIGLDTTNGNFAYNSALTNPGGNSLGLTKLGTGILTLGASNTNTGTTRVLAGTLAEGASGFLADTSALTVDGATSVFDLGSNHSDTVAAVTLSNGGSITGSGTSALTGSSYALQSGSVSAILAGSGINLTKTTTGTVVLSGVNTYTGTTSVGATTGTDAGILQLSGSGKISNAATTVFAGTLDLNGTTQTITTLGLGAGAAATSATVAIGAGELRLGGNVTYTATNNPIGAVISGGGLLSLLGDRTFTVNDSTRAFTDLAISAGIQNGDVTARNLIKAGVGNMVISGTNTYTGTTTISAGMLQFAKQVSLYNNGAAGTGWTGTNIVVSSAATLGLNVGGTGEFTASDVNTLSALSGMASGSFLALDSSNGNFSDSGVIAGTGVGLTKLGANSVTLSGANTYTGLTTVNSGTLVLDRSTGGAGTLNGVTGTALTLGGGAFQFKGANNTASAQTMGNLTLTTNTVNGITVTPTGGSGTAALTLGTTWTRASNTGSGLNINLPTGATLTSSPTAANGLVTGTGTTAFATVTDATGTGFATVSGGNIIRYTGASTLTAAVGSSPTTNFVTRVGDAGYNSVNNSLTMTTTAPTINSLHLDTSGGTGILNLGGLTMTLMNKGVLMTGTNSFTIQSGTLAANGNDEIIIHQYSTGSLTLLAGLTLNGNLTKTGPGELILQDTDFYGGTTSILGGQVTAQNNSHIGFSTLINVAAGAALSFKPLTTQFTNNTAAITLNGAGLAANPAGALNNWGGNNTLSGFITLAGNTTIQSDNGLLTLTGGIGGPFNLTLAGAGNGAITAAFALGTGGLTKNGAGTWTFSSPAGYSGGTTITGGSLVLSGTGSFGTGGLTVSGGTADLGMSSITNTLGALTGGGTIANGTITNNGSNYDLQSGTVSAVLNGTNGLIKSTTGSMTLSGANNYTGATSITGGQLTIKHSTALGTIAGGTSVSSGAALVLDGTGGDLNIGAEALTLNGAGVTASPAGALRSLAGTNIYGGLLTLGSDSTIKVDAGSLNISNGGTITGSGFGLTIAGAGNVTIASNIATDTGSVTKSGSGTVTLSGTNTYSGLTTVSLGTLVIGSSSALGSSSVNLATGTVLRNSSGGAYSFGGDVVNNGTIDSQGNNMTIASGQTFSGTGLVTGAGTYIVEGTLSPGNSPGTLTVDTDTTVVLGAGATTIWELNALVDNNDGTAGTNWDTIVLNLLSGFSVDGTLQIELDGISFSHNAYWESDHEYTLFGGAWAADGQYGDFTGITGNVFTNGYGTGTFGFDNDSNNITYSWVAVPEPQTWALAAMGLAAVLFRLRRQQRAE